MDNYYYYVAIAIVVLYLIIFCDTYYLYLLQTEPVEYWDDDDSIIDEDFPPDAPMLTEETLCHSQSGQLYVDQHAIVWWVVVFTSLFQTLHSLLVRAVQWLLNFLLCLIAVLGKFSPKIFNIVQVFPGTISQHAYTFEIFPLYQLLSIW